MTEKDSSSFRWAVLVLIPFTPFAGHFFKNSLSSLELFLLDDPNLHMNSTMYGTLVASFSMFSMFMPLFGGHYIDTCGHRNGMVLFLMIGLVGVLIVIASLYAGEFWGCVFGGAIFGMAHGNVVVAMRAVISRYFADNEITFALGCSVGVTCFAKMGARAVVAPVAIYFGTYMASFWLIFLVCCCSLGFSVAYFFLSKHVLGSRTTPKLLPADGDAKSFEGDALELGEARESMGGEEEERSLLQGTPTSGASYGSNLSAASGEGAPSTDKQAKKKRMKRIKSLVSIRNLLSFGGVSGLGGSTGPVVVIPGDEGLHMTTPGTLEKKLKSDEAAKSKDPLVKMRRERSNSEVGKEAAPRSSVSFGGGMTSERRDRFYECCSLESFVGQLSGLSTSFWLLALLHMLFLLVFHLFPNISGHFLHQRWGMNPAEAGYVSSLLSAFVVVGAPLTGYVIDRTGGQLYVVLAASVLACYAYYLLNYTFMDPVYPILLLSLAESCVPTILMALMPLAVSRSSYGIAFGIAEIFDAVGSITGNILMGYIRDATQSYRQCMDFIILLNFVCFCLTVILIILDRTTEEQVLNTAWHQLALKGKGRGLGVERGRQKKLMKVKRARDAKREKRRSGVAANK